MAVRKQENKLFTLLSYTRTTYADSEQLKAELSNYGSVLSDKRDVVLDLTALKTITSPEIGAMARLAKTFGSSMRTLRIIPGQEIRPLLMSTNLDKLPNMVIYKDKNEFLLSVKNLAGKTAGAT